VALRDAVVVRVDVLGRWVVVVRAELEGALVVVMGGLLEATVGCNTGWVTPVAGADIATVGMGMPSC
jgi:hypothetical protein